MLLYFTVFQFPCYDVLADFLPVTFAAFLRSVWQMFLVVFSSHISTFSLILKGYNIGEEIMDLNLGPFPVLPEAAIFF